MSRRFGGEPYVGQTFGLITVQKRIGRRLYCQCECGAFKYLHAANIKTNPPKTHRSCQLDFQFEMPFDNVRKEAYKKPSTPLGSMK